MKMTYDDWLINQNITPQDLAEYTDTEQQAIRASYEAGDEFWSGQTGSFEEQYHRKHEKWGTMEKQGLVVGRGDNKRVVPPDEVYKLAALHCNYQEIADWFGIKRETLKYNFRDIIQKAYSETNQRLRKAQIDTAVKGNAAMLIWLGKNMLNQSDNPIDSDSNQPLPWQDD